MRTPTYIARITDHTQTTTITTTATTTATGSSSSRATTTTTTTATTRTHLYRPAVVVPCVDKARHDGWSSINVPNNSRRERKRKLVFVASPFGNTRTRNRRYAASLFSSLAMDQVPTAQGAERVSSPCQHWCVNKYSVAPPSLPPASINPLEFTQGATKSNSPYGSLSWSTPRHARFLPPQRSASKDPQWHRAADCSRATQGDDRRKGRRIANSPPQVLHVCRIHDARVQRLSLHVPHPRRSSRA